MLTRRQTLQAILGAPAFALAPLPRQLAPFSYTPPGAPTISLPPLRPGEMLKVVIRCDDGRSWTHVVKEPA